MTFRFAKLLLKVFSQHLCEVFDDYDVVGQRELFVDDCVFFLAYADGLEPFFFRAFENVQG